MQVFWDLGEVNVVVIIDEFFNLKFVYNIVFIIVRILENKEFVDYRCEGRGYIYFFLVEKGDYSN